MKKFVGNPLDWWLYSRGGRTRDDLHRDGKGQLYVLMADGQGELERVYLPDELKRYD